MLTPAGGAYPTRLWRGRANGMGQTLLPTLGAPSAVGQGRGGHPYWTTSGRWRGLGQSCDLVDANGNCVDLTPTTGSTTDTTGSVQGACGIVPLAPCPGSTASSPQATTSSGSINWTNVIQSAIKGVSTVVQQQTNPFAPKNIPAGTYYARGPGGTVISTAGAGSPYTAAGYTTTSLTSGLSSMLPILLVGGVVLMMMSRR